VYRQQLLGFNAVRLPFSFKDWNLPGRTDYMVCHTASTDDIRRTVTPPGEWRVCAGDTPHVLTLSATRCCAHARSSQRFQAGAPARQCSTSNHAMATQLLLGRCSPSQTVL
jgi:hypothetical protein